MSTISGVGHGRTGWQDVDRSSRGPARAARMFAKVDGSGDGAELQGLLDKTAQQRGGDAADAATALKAMDRDGSGPLDAGELDAGMKRLMPAPSSTLAQAPAIDLSA